METPQSNTDDIKLYCYMNSNEIDPYLLCMLCRQPYQSPVNCMKCGYTLCAKCLDEWRKQKHPCPGCHRRRYRYKSATLWSLVNQLYSLPVECLLCQATNIKKGDFADHLTRSCPGSAPKDSKNQSSIMKSLINANQKVMGWLPRTPFKSLTDKVTAMIRQ